MVRFITVLITLCLTVFSCDNDSSTNPSADSLSYTPLNSGDVTQFVSLTVPRFCWKSVMRFRVNPFIRIYTCNGVSNIDRIKIDCISSN